MGKNLPALGPVGRRALDRVAPDTDAAAADVQAVERVTAAVKVKVEPVALGLLIARDTLAWPQVKRSNRQLSCWEGGSVLKTQAAA